MDEADYGFAVTELEVCVPVGAPEGSGEGPAVAAAKARVAGLARALGLESEGGGGVVIRGKLEEFLARRNPAHHVRLVEAGVFKA